MSSSTAASIGRWWHRLSPLIGLLLFVAALAVLGRELRQMPPSKLAAALKQFPGSALALAGFYTFLNYLILTGYDQLAFLYIRRRFRKWQIAMASFVGYAIANNVGFALLSGTSARYRFYSRWGLSGQEISRVVLFYSGTFWLGLLVLGGWALVGGPMARLDTLRRRLASRARRAGCCWRLRSPIRFVALFRRRPIYHRRPRDHRCRRLGWCLHSSCCPRWTGVSPPRSSTCCSRSRGPTSSLFVGIFLAAQLVALVSHVPGGLGVFESLMILMLQLPAVVVLPALAMFRVIYYLAPLAVALRRPHHRRVLPPPARDGANGATPLER